MHYGDGGLSGRSVVAWDFNLLSLDGYSPETGWIRIDTSRLTTIHMASFEKRRGVRRRASDSRRARRVLAKCSKREEPCEEALARNCMRGAGGLGGCGLRGLSKQGMYTSSGGLEPEDFQE